MKNRVTGRKRVRLILVPALLLGVWRAAPPAHGQSAPGGERDFARAYQSFRANYLSELRRHGFVGSSFYLVRDNRVVAREFYGLADAGRGAPVDEETIYHWASITKTF